MNTQNVRFERINGYLGMIPPIPTQLANSAVLILGVYLCMTGEFTVGMVMAFQGFLGSFMTPAQTLISAGQKFQLLLSMRKMISNTALRSG